MFQSTAATGAGCPFSSVTVTLSGCALRPTAGRWIVRGVSIKDRGYDDRCTA